MKKTLMVGLFLVFAMVSCTACVTMFNDPGKPDAHSEARAAKERMNEICAANPTTAFAHRSQIVSCGEDMCSLAMVDLICVDGEAKGSTSVQDVPRAKPEDMKEQEIKPKKGEIEV